ncbi:hypothetical protein [Dactylosporangium sp. CA-139066]|uniref:hypothetical protein n=1 Tax=Dactylosporangium sp. CA-139066 TaxID=3239930 RepID=UPI003D8F1395
MAPLDVTLTVSDSTVRSAKMGNLCTETGQFVDAVHLHLQALAIRVALGTTRAAYTVDG